MKTKEQKMIEMIEGWMFLLSMGKSQDVERLMKMYVQYVKETK